MNVPRVPHEFLYGVIKLKFLRVVPFYLLSHVFILFFYLKLEKKPSFVWSFFSTIVQLFNLKLLNIAKKISVGLPSSSIQNWGKPVKGFLSYDRTNIRDIHRQYVPLEFLYGVHKIRISPLCPFLFFVSCFLNVFFLALYSAWKMFALVCFLSMYFKTNVG